MKDKRKIFKIFYVVIDNFLKWTISFGRNSVSSTEREREQHFMKTQMLIEWQPAVSKLTKVFNSNILWWSKVMCFFFLFLFFGICVVANWKWKCLINIMMNFSKLVHWTQWKKVEKWLKSQLVDIFIMMRNSKKKKWTQNQNTKKQRTTLEWSSSCNGYGKRKL